MSVDTTCIYIVVLVQGRDCCVLIHQKPCTLYMVILRSYIKLKHPRYTIVDCLGIVADAPTFTDSDISSGGETWLNLKLAHRHDMTCCCLP